MAWQERLQSDELILFRTDTCKMMLLLTIDFCRNMWCGTSAPPTGQFPDQRQERAVTVRRAPCYHQERAIYEWPPLPGETGRKKLLRGTIKWFFSIMCLVAHWKILSTFSYISCFKIFIDIWNWQVRFNGWTKAFMEPVPLTRKSHYQNGILVFPPIASQGEL